MLYAASVPGDLRLVHGLVLMVLLGTSGQWWVLMGGMGLAICKGGATSKEWVGGDPVAYSPPCP